MYSNKFFVHVLTKSKRNIKGDQTMAIIQRIMGAMGIKSASKTVKTAKSLATAIAQPSVTSKAIDKKMSADAAQGMAMVNMSGKKAYVAPKTNIYTLPHKGK